MKIKTFLLFGGAVFLISGNSFALSSSSAAQKTSAANNRHNLDSSDILDGYTDFKNMLNKEYGFNYALDISYMPQRGAPSGKKTAFQTMITPSFTWQNFNNEYGIGTLNFSYNIVRYGGKSAQGLADNIGIVTPINDYDDKSTSFNELYYTYQLPRNYDWLTVALGQISVYNFDGTTYNSNQQINFINYALSQNASASYSTAGLGGYLQANPNNNWSFVIGAADATNVDAQSIRFNNLDKKHFTSFAYAAYTPVISRLGQSEISFLFYNQPGVEEQPQTTNGWSVNLSQNIGEKTALFARINGVSGDMEEINQSWSLGGVYNNPLNRNPLDQIGLAFAYNKIDEKAVGTNLDNPSEKVIEAYWAWGISKWATLTPDIQFYIDPAQNNKSDYATVFTLRATLLF